MSQPVFWELLAELVQFGGLRDTRSVTAAEKLATFLYQARTGITIRPLKNRWQHSADTISRNFHQVLNAIVASSFYKRHVRLPPDECPREIRENAKLYPYFADVRSTVDGSLYEAHFSADMHARYRSRKGMLRLN
ncbi:hypothetical protein BV20DRAFT_955429 [Pilatotrama ljubarskyi]|nr:hypothetical protein BV20DRAFT_955429 [Pilatotrama ljubarskyi]